MSYIGNTNTTQGFTPAIDYFSGNGSTTAFTLSRPVASVAQVQAVVNNVAQNPSSAYTVSGNTITFTSAPSSGTNNIYVYYTSPITQVIAPGQNTVYPSSLSTTNALYWDTSGNVGIGTTSPTNKLDVAGSIGLNNGSAVSFKDSGGTYRVTVTWDSGNNINIGDTGNATSSILKLFAGGASGQTLFYRNNVEQMRIDSSGNVGIGTSSPASKLNVASGMIRTDAGYGMEFGGATNFIIGNSPANTMRFYTNNAESMRIDSSGNLLVGTSSGSGARCRIDYSGQSFGMRIGTTATSGTAIQFVYEPSSQVGTITTTTTTTSYNSGSSDYRLKENISRLSGALEKVQAMNPVSFTWKETGSQDIGFVAHEIQQIIPETVTGEKDAVDKNGNPVYQQIYSSPPQMIATLTAAIQELKQIVDAQASTIQSLTDRITALETK